MSDYLLPVCQDNIGGIGIWKNQLRDDYDPLQAVGIGRDTLVEFCARVGERTR